MTLQEAEERLKKVSDGAINFFEKNDWEKKLDSDDENEENENVAKRLKSFGSSKSLRRSTAGTSINS